MIRALSTLILTVAFLSIGAPPALAQLGQPDPWESARIHIGPVAFTPGVALKTLGWETNVFNSPDKPKRDFVATPAGTIDWWLRAGRARFHGVNEFSYTYFQEFKDQGGFNQSHSLTFEVPLSRFKPYVGGSYVNSNDRVGYEIDARARHTETAARGGVIARLTAKTGVDLYATHTRFRYTGDERFLGTSLSQQFNRQSSSAGGTIRYTLTPLTTLTLTADWANEQFDERPTRNNRSFRLLPGVELAPAALLKGSAKVGYRRFDSLDADTPDFSGVVATADISYVLLGRTRFSVNVGRDVAFSFADVQPYYLQTGFGGSVRQGLGRGVDVEARAATYQLDYWTSKRAAANLRGRVDEVTTYGGGVGYTLTGGQRIAFYIDQWKRSSPTFDFRAYDGLRFGFSATAGL